MLLLAPLADFHVPDRVSLHDGWTPDGRSSNANGITQGGSNADNVLGDAFVKGLDSYPSINWTLGWEAMARPISLSIVILKLICIFYAGQRRRSDPTQY
jgi:Glycosyl hydrolase family 92